MNNTLSWVIFNWKDYIGQAKPTPEEMVGALEHMHGLRNRPTSVNGYNPDVVRMAMELVNHYSTQVEVLRRALEYADVSLLMAVQWEEDNPYVTKIAYDNMVRCRDALKETEPGKWTKPPVTSKIYYESRSNI